MSCGSFERSALETSSEIHSEYFSLKKLEGIYHELAQSHLNLKTTGKFPNGSNDF